MNKITSLFLLLLQLSLSYAQVPEWSWAKNYGAYNYFSQTTVTGAEDGNVYLASNFDVPTISVGSQTFTNTSVSADFYIVKHDQDGNILWAKHEGGAGHDHIQSITSDSSGNLFVLGRAFATITIGSFTFDGGGVFIAKYDADGNVLWATNPTTAYEVTRIKLDSAGNIYFTGSYQQAGIQVGAIALTNPNSNASFNNANNFIAKLDSSGAVIWAKQTQCIGNSVFPNLVWDFATDSDGNVFIGGSLWSDSVQLDNITLVNNSTTDSANVFMAKYDSNGNVVWAHQPGTSNTNNYLYAVSCDAIGNVAFSGSFSGTIMFGTTVINASSSGNNMFVAKYNTAGNLLWAKSATGVLYSNIDASDFDDAGNLYVGGSYFADPGQTLNFGNGAISNNTNGAYFFVTKYSVDGMAQWARGGGPSIIDHNLSLDCRNENEIHLGGFFNNYTNETMNFGNVVVQHNPESYYNAFVAKLYHEELGVQTHSSDGFSVAPNPTNGIINVKTISQSRYSLVDNLGKIVAQGKLAEAGEIDISGLPVGVYYLEVDNNGVKNVKKIIKE
ncbi:MAG TPA: T9SS type A sorting domain-containing protein [Flavobacterium sp.]